MKILFMTAVWSAIAMGASRSHPSSPCVDGKEFWKRVRRFVAVHDLKPLLELATKKTLLEGPYESDTLKDAPIANVAARIKKAAKGAALSIANEPDSNKREFVEVTGWKNVPFQKGVFGAKIDGKCWRWVGFYDDTPPPQ